MTEKPNNPRITRKKPSFDNPNNLGKVPPQAVDLEEAVQKINNFLTKNMHLKADT